MLLCKLILHELFSVDVYVFYQNSFITQVICNSESSCYIYKNNQTYTGCDSAELIVTSVPVFELM